MSIRRFNERNLSPSPSGPPKKRSKQGYSMNFAPAMNTEPDSTAPDMSNAPAMTTPSGSTAPATITAYASTASASAVPATTTYDRSNHVDLNDLPDSPHTPPPAPRKARHENHSMALNSDDQHQLDKLYKVFRLEFEGAGLQQSRAAILKFARKLIVGSNKLTSKLNEDVENQTGRLGAQEQQIWDQKKEIKELKKAIKTMTSTSEYKEVELTRKGSQSMVLGNALADKECEQKAQDKIIEQQEDRIIKQMMRNEYLEQLLMEHDWTRDWLDWAVARMEQKGDSAKEAIKAMVKAKDEKV